MLIAVQNKTSFWRRGTHELNSYNSLFNVPINRLSLTVAFLKEQFLISLQFHLSPISSWQHLFSLVLIYVMLGEREVVHVDVVADLFLEFATYVGVYFEAYIFYVRVGGTQK